MKTRWTAFRTICTDIAVNLAAIIAGTAIATPFVLILAAPFIGGW